VVLGGSAGRDWLWTWPAPPFRPRRRAQSAPSTSSC